MSIIMICSPTAEVGKDLATKFFEENYNGIRIAFADKVKEIAKLMGWNGEKDEKGRRLLTNIGYAGVKYDKYVWVKNVLHQIDYRLWLNNNIIISDLRFIHEEQYIRDRYENVYVIGIESDIFGNKTLINDSSQIEYNSIKKDFIVKNNGTVIDLYKELNKIIQKLP